VILQDVSRLTRRVADFANFLETARDSGTSICSNGMVCDPASDDVAASLGLEVEALFGAFDNRLRTRRFMAARIARAHEGKAVSPPPIGYIRSVRGECGRRTRIVRCRRHFSGSATLPEAHLARQDRRVFPGTRFVVPAPCRGSLKWGPVDESMLHQVLHNPAYDGTYAFLRHSSQKRQGDRAVVVKRRLRTEWIVTRNHHEPYVPRETWQQIHDMHRPLPSRRSSRGSCR
jgi:hypothetical protein